MALRILWDKYETALLIDVCLQIDSGAISRKDAIGTLSKRLRQRAVEIGLGIDEVFRNENGISMQIGNVQRLLHHIPDAEKHNTKVFIDMVNMYYEDKEQFDAILSEAKGEEQPVKSNQELFVEWLSEKVSPARLSDYYMVFDDIDDYAKKKKITTGAFFETTDSTISLKLLNSINADKYFRFTHKRQMRIITDVSQLFHKYTKENKEQRAEAKKAATPVVLPSLRPEPALAPKAELQEEPKLSPPMTVPEAVMLDQEADVDQVSSMITYAVETEHETHSLEDAPSDALVVDFERDNSYAFTKPVSAIYFGDEVFETSWRKLYAKVCELLIEDYPDEFSALRDGPVSSDRNHLVHDADTAKRLISPEEISEGYFVETHRSASDLIHNIKILLDLCRVDYENLIIRYIKTSEKNDESEAQLLGDEGEKNDSSVIQSLNDCRGDVVSSQPKTSYRDPVIEFLVKNEIKYVDKRYNLGCLWIIGGKEISEIISALKKAGVSLYFKASGGVATQGRDAWWTKDNTDNVSIKDIRLDSNSGSEAEPAEGTRLISAVESRDAFSSWLHAEGLADGSIRTLLWAFSKVNEYAVRSSIISGSLFEITNPLELDQIWNKLIRIDSFVQYRRQNSVISFAFNKYRAFRNSEEGASSVAPRIVVQRVINPGSSAESRRKAFVSWMESQGFSLSTCNGYASAIVTIDDYATSENILTKPLYDIENYSELILSCKRLQASEDFIKFNRRQHNRLSAAINRYLEFRMTVDESPLVPVVNQSNDLSRSSEGLTPAQGREAFEEWLETTNCPPGSIKTYADSVETIGRFLISQGYEERDIFTITDITRLESFRSMLRDDEDFKKARRSSVSLDLHGLKRYISYRQETSSGAVDDNIIERFSRILRDSFDNGFRPNSIIDQNRFRQYYADCYGEELAKSDAEIVQIISRIGTRQDDRIYLRETSDNGSLIEEMKRTIRDTFAAGASCIFFSELYDRFQEMLSSQLQVFSPEVMKDLLLSSSDGEYRSGKGFFYLKRVAPNADSDIRRFLRQSPIPLSYSALHEHLWYIPLDTIKRCLVTTADIVNVAHETYFYAPNLPISAEELNRIAVLIHNQLGQKSFLTDLELRTLIDKECPSVAINTESFTTWGLRNCLSVLLRDRFAFVGPIISEKGQALNTSQVFAEFSRSHDLMTLDELKTFAKDINNGIIYWDSVMEVMVRISQDEFVPKDQIDFNVEAIDSVLDDLVDGDYASLKSFRLFLHFPSTSVRWNEFVLESFVAGASKEFSLMHSSYTATECCGAIVRNASKIKDFQDLVTDVLAHSDSWHNKDDALTLLVNQGYLQRKHYTKIDMIITKAMQQREQISDRKK